MGFKRAVSKKQKIQRRNEILNAANKLLSEKGWGKVSFNAIAREAGFTKSNMYRYYSGKEEIFLELITIEFEKVASTLLRKLQGYRHITIDAFSLIWTLCLLGNVKFLQLLPYLALSIDKVKSQDVIESYRHQFRISTKNLAPKMADFFGGMDEALCFQYFYLLVSLTSGLYSMTQDIGELKEKLKAPNLSTVNVSLTNEMKTAAKVLLRGMISK